MEGKAGPGKWIRRAKRRVHSGTWIRRPERRDEGVKFEMGIGDKAS